MLFVSIGKFKAASTTRQRVARRVGWKYPMGMRVIAEYWLQTTDPALPGLIVISESDDVAPIMKAIAEWDDFMDLTVVPALTAEQGLELAGKLAAAP
jgi:hypothetical protein